MHVCKYKSKYYIILNDHQNKREQNQILEYKLNSEGRIIQYHQ